MSDWKKPVKLAAKRRGVGQFLWKERRLIMLSAIAFWIFAFGCVCYLSWTTGKSLAVVLTEWTVWDAAFTLFTLFVGLAVFFGEAIEDWEERLPNRLTIFFLFERRTLLVCYYAHLPHAGDIRTWGQQIGSQMCDRDQLDFSPFSDLRRLGVEVDADGAFVHYQAVIYLRKIPAKLDKIYSTPDDKHLFWCKVLRHRGGGDAFESKEESAKHRPQQVPNLSISEVADQ